MVFTTKVSGRTWGGGAKPHQVSMTWMYSSSF